MLLNDKFFFIISIFLISDNENNLAKDEKTRFSLIKFEKI